MSNIFDHAEREARSRPGRRKVIIACGVAGVMHTPSMSEFLPASPQAIAAQAIEAARAGAAVLRLHARDGEGRPTEDADIYRRTSALIAGETDAILNFVTGGVGASLEARLAYPLAVEPEMCSVDMGSMNLSFHRAAQGVVEWKHGWEKPYVEGSRDAVQRSSFSDIHAILTRLGAAAARFEFVCRDVGHLHNLAYFVEEGLVGGPMYVQCAFGALGGLGSDPENLFLMRSAADRLLGRENYEFSVAGAGRQQMPLVAMGAIMGGHVRVGMEDSLYLGRNLMATSCAAQVLKIRRLLEDLSFEVATPAEAREILQTKGADKVRLHG